MSTVKLQKELTYEEAVRVLGFKSGDVIVPHLPALRGAEQRMAALIEKTRDEQYKARLREDLAKLTAALRAVEAEHREAAPAPRRRPRPWLWVSLMLVGCVVGLAWVGNLWVEQERRKVSEKRVDELLQDGQVALEKRRWPEASEIFEQVLELRPQSQGAMAGLRKIEDGKEEERRQQIGFLMGTAQAAIEARRWDEAESTLRDLREMDPENSKLVTLKERITGGRMVDRIVTLLDAAEEAIREEQWETVAMNARKLETLAPTHADLPRLRNMAVEGMKLLEERKTKARELYQAALVMDDGTFSQEALEILREAIRLAERPEYQALYDKISSYARTLQVPEEFETIGAALAVARPKDKVRVGEGTYRESLVLPGEIDLEGAGSDKTIVVCEAVNASVLVVPPGSSGSRISGCTLRQTGIILTDERYPIVAIDSGELALEDCRVERGAGHGVAVVNGGRVSMRSVRVVGCGWDGLAVYGQGSRGEARECRFEGNLHHGVDAWDGGAVSISRSRSSANGLAGIVVMSPGVPSKVEGSTCDENRELGILVANGATVEVTGSLFSSNLLGGVLVRDPGTQAVIVGNRILKNGTAGLVADKRSRLLRFEDNEIRENSGQQVKLDADLEAEKVPPTPEPIEIPDVGAPREAPEAPGAGSTADSGKNGQ